MSKKIAILTQPLGHNYGGLIQNYALQQILKNRGVNVITVSRDFKKSPYIHSLLSRVKRGVFNFFRRNKVKVLSKKEEIVIYSEMHRFINTYITTSEKIYTSSSLKYFIDKQKFDTIVVGSDQTWRPKYSPCIYNYFLDFVSGNTAINKIAYATSFGTSEWEYSTIETERCKELAQEFNAISVREDSGRILSKKYLNIETVWTLDPTLLLTPDSYLPLFSKYKQLEYPFLFNYFLDQNPLKNDYLKRLSSILNLEVYAHQPKKSLETLQDFTKLDDYIYPSLEGWLASFYHASFVITDSFHGTVFSILFNKPFLTIVNGNRGAARFHSLLKRLDLEERLISDAKQTDLTKLTKSIDYGPVNEILAEWRRESLDFVEKHIIRK